MVAEVTPDSELVLEYPGQRAVVSPWGASLRQYRVVGADSGDSAVLWGYSGGARKQGGQGDVLMPFPGRIADGRYQFDGEVFQLERNDKEGPNAIHGFVRSVPWQVLRRDAAAVVFRVQLLAEVYASKGYPFSLDIELTYQLHARGISCAFSIRNIGPHPAPVGAGFHPYFTVGGLPIHETELQIPASAFVEFNQRLVPTGRLVSVDGTEWDYRTRRPIGSRQFNHCYVDLTRDADGLSRAVLLSRESGRRIEVTMDRTFSALVVYTGDAIPGAARQAVAIEPMTCATDAFNHPEWGVIRLLPDKTVSGTFEVCPSWL